MSLKEEYYKKILEELKKDMNVESSMAVPRLKKIIVNMGIGKNRDNKAFMQEAIDDMTKVSGQKITERKARLSISNFKLRQGQVVGLAVTLRGDRMWYFYEKLVKIVLPRVKDFQGVSKKSLDGVGGYSLGFKDYTIFPEIDPNKISHLKPIQVTISTTAVKSDNTYKLLKALGMPFRD